MLISTKMILTAAHCVCRDGKLPDVVFLGGEPLSDYEKFSNLTYWVRQAIIYPDYDPNQAYHDIAILEIDYYPTEYEGLRPICLWKDENLTTNETIAIGYGLTAFAGRDSKQLLKVGLQLFSNEHCEPFYKGQKTFTSGISDDHLCAGDKNEEKDTCQGDSGGPLIVKYNERNYAVDGITSSGQACSGYPPAIYTKIFPYIDWITKILQDRGEYLEPCQ